MNIFLSVLLYVIYVVTCGLIVFFIVRYLKRRNKERQELMLLLMEIKTSLNKIAYKDLSNE